MSHRDLTEDQRRETVTETMASFALEGMYPTDEQLQGIRQYVSGEATLQELLSRARAKYGLE